MKRWKVTVNFAGYYSCDETYEVEAETLDEAEELALEEARDDLCVLRAIEDYE